MQGWVFFIGESLARKSTVRSVFREARQRRRLLTVAVGVLGDGV